MYSPRIGVLADDLTGGGDIGVQFADKGLKVLLAVDVDAVKDVPKDSEVWIINTQSRSDPAKIAAKKVKKAVELLKEWNAGYYYKKIDSTLRGQVGAELESFIEGLEVNMIPFCAAFPAMGRVTIDSIHYVNGVIVSKSPYGKDIKSPVTESNIEKLLAAQMGHPEKVKIKDAVSDDDLVKLSEECTGNVFAGAAAWAGKLTEKWVSSNRMVPSMMMSPGPVLVISGSLNPVSLAQIDYWEKQGMDSININSPDPDPDFEGDLIVKNVLSEDTSDGKKFNRLACQMWLTKKWDRVILNGGDTAYEFMIGLNMYKVNILQSLMPGVAVTQCKTDYIVMKPGGYGDDKSIVELARLISGK
ncbi:four-carbon acid sugar kinase family protein [Elusimicrobiota bacterium]